MKFVPDISGVCSIVGTFEITSKPRKIASTRMVSSMTSGRVRHAAASFGRPATHAPAVISSAKSRLARRRARGARAERRRFAHRAGSRLRHQRGEVDKADDRDAALRDLVAGCGQLAVPPVSAARSTITEPGRIARPPRRDQARRGAAGDERGRDHDVEVGNPRLERALLLRLLLGGQLAWRNRPRSPRPARRGRETSRRATRPAP